MSTNAEVKKPTIPVSLPFLILGVLSICAAALTYTIYEFQQKSLNESLLDVMLFGGFALIILGGIGDAYMDHRQSKKVKPTEYNI